MYLTKLEIKNFRIFGEGENKLEMNLNNDLNLLVGENGSGKSSIIDALRILLLTTDYDRLFLSEEDFHINEEGNRANNLKIKCTFDNLDKSAEAPPLIDWAGVKKENGKENYYIDYWIEASYDQTATNISFRKNLDFDRKAGVNGRGKKLSKKAKDLFRSTYLKPLRDAKKELTPGRNSRLSQILDSHPDIEDAEEDLTGILQDANKKIRKKDVIEDQKKDLNNVYLKNFSLQTDNYNAKIKIDDSDIKKILEKLELTLVDDNIDDSRISHGLGLENILFMAVEFLLTEKQKGTPLILIEEPEAHLHPQLQLNLVNFLNQKSEEDLQIIMTSHSPNISSKLDLKKTHIIRDGSAYSMAEEYTNLKDDGYRFLERFLDVTKSNFLFSNGVIIVKGHSEKILLNTLARLIGYPLEEYGVSIINVGHTGLFRYSKIFKRKKGEDMNIKVSCVSDLDLLPNEAKDDVYYSDGKRRKFVDDLSESELEEYEDNKKVGNDENIKTFISDSWTLEYELAKSDLRKELYKAIYLSKSNREDNEKLKEEAEENYNELINRQRNKNKIALEIYKDLYSGNASKAETAQYLSNILEKKNKQNNLSNEQWQEMIPSYLKKSIIHATKKQEN